MTTQYQSLGITPQAGTAVPYEGIMPQASRSTTTTDRFHLEQQMLDCWQIVEDIHLLHDMEATTEDMAKVASVYDYKFKRMWATFEALVKARKL